MYYGQEYTINSIKKAMKLTIGRDLQESEEYIVRKCYELGYRDAKEIFNNGQIEKIRV